MPKLNVEDLDRIKKSVEAAACLTSGNKRARITVHMGTCGIAAGAEKVMATMQERIRESAAADIILTTSGCAGFCSREPMVTVEIGAEEPVKYVQVDDKAAGLIFDEHVMKGQIVEKYVVGIGREIYL